MAKSGTPDRVLELGLSIGVDGIGPLVAPVLEVGEDEVSGQAGVIVELVIGAHGAAPAQALVAILAHIDGVVIRRGAAIGVQVRLRLNVVVSAPVVIVAGARDHAPALGDAEALAHRKVHKAHVAAVLDWRIAQRGNAVDRGRLAGHL
jgi:hypothetical protein